MGHAETAAQLIDAGAQVDLQNKVRECGRAGSSCWRSKSMCVYMCVCVYMMCVCVCVCVFLSLFVFTFLPASVFFVSVWKCLYSYIHTCVCLSLCPYTYIQIIDTYICMRVGV